MKIQQYGSGLHIDASLRFLWYDTLRESHQEMEKIIKTLASETERHVNLISIWMIVNRILAKFVN